MNSALVYPVYSRRAGGLSLGIDLFGGLKRCSFDCPYCELFPSQTSAAFKLTKLETDLASAIKQAVSDNRPLRDICFSGSGEPTLSEYFQPALELAGRLRAELAPNTTLVVITNASRLSDSTIASLLSAAIKAYNLDLWAKWDAGTETWYRKINRSDLAYDQLAAGLLAFAVANPITIQTMICALDGAIAPPEEVAAWLESAEGLAVKGQIRRFQLYGKARPSPHDPLATAVPTALLEARASALRTRLARAGKSNIPVVVFP